MITRTKNADQEKPEEMLILGVGNPLMSDDGAGIRAVEWLAREDLPANVCIKEAGTPGWGLASWLEGWNSVILVDAVEMGEEPGTWRRFKPEDVKMIINEQAYSLHETDLACGLALADALHLLPENLVIYGIEPADTSPGEGLSPEVGAKLPGMVHKILEEANTTHRFLRPTRTWSGSNPEGKY